MAAGIFGAQRVPRAWRLWERYLKCREGRDGVRAVAKRRPERPVRRAQVPGGKAPQAPVVHQVGDEVEGPRPPEDDGPVAGQEVREDGEERQQERETQPEQVSPASREAVPDLAHHGRLLDEIRGSAAA